MIDVSRNLGLSQVPQEDLRKLTASQILVLREILYLTSRNGPSAEGGPANCRPGLRYLAGKAGVSIWTVSRGIKKLQDMRLIAVYHVRGYHQRWKSNLYLVGIRLLIRVQQYKDRFLKKIHRLRYTANRVLSGPEFDEGILRAINENWTYDQVMNRIRGEA